MCKKRNLFHQAFTFKNQGRLPAGMFQSLHLLYWVCGPVAINGYILEADRHRQNQMQKPAATVFEMLSTCCSQTLSRSSEGPYWFNVFWVARHWVSCVKWALYKTTDYWWLFWVRAKEARLSFCGERCTCANNKNHTNLHLEFAYETQIYS